MSPEESKLLDGAPDHVPSSKPKPDPSSIAAMIGQATGHKSEEVQKELDAQTVIRDYVRELDHEFTPSLDDMIAQAKRTTEGFKGGSEGEPPVPVTEQELPPEGAGIPREPTKPDPTEPTPEAETETLKAQINALQNMLLLQAQGGTNNLAALIPLLANGGKLDQNMLTLLMSAQAKPPTEEPKQDLQGVASPIEVKVQDVFGGDAEIDLSTPDNLNKLLQHVVSVAVENAMLKVPDIVTKKIGHELAVRKRADAWYEANPDLKPHRMIVGLLADNITAMLPGASFEQVLTLVGPMARQQLGIKAVEPSGDPTNPSGDTPGIGVRRAVTKKAGGPQLTSQQKQIQHLILRQT